MRRRTLILVVHLVTAVLVASSLGIYLLVKSGEDDDRVHEPILIVADSYFTSENGVSSGTGTEADPFIIQDLIIEVPSDPGLQGQGIRVSYTTAHFIIRNVTIRPDCVGTERSAAYPVGIFLNSAQNAVVEACTIDDMAVGIEMAMASGTTIRDNTLTGCGIGAHSELSPSLGYQYGLLVTGNEFVNDTIGLHVYYSPWDLDVNENSFVDNGDPVIIEGCRGVAFAENEISVTGASHQDMSGGPIFRYCHDLDVSSNTVTGVGRDGFSVEGSLGVVVSDNSAGCAGRCLVISGSTEVNVTGNVLSSGLAGTWVQSSDDVEITLNSLSGAYFSFVTISPDGTGGAVSVFHNRVEVLSVALVDDGQLDVSWDAGYPAGGNFWEGDIGSYILEDLDEDGISDGPFYLDEDSVDRYPLMATPL